MAQTVEPDWDQLVGMINELATRKGLFKKYDAHIEKARSGKESGRLPNISYRRLSLEIKKSPSLMYGIVDRYHRPTADTLAALADYAAQDPRVDHLSERGLWLRAGGVIRSAKADTYRSDGLDDTERRILAILEDLTPDEKDRLMRLIETGKELISTRGGRAL